MIPLNICIDLLAHRENLTKGQREAVIYYLKKLKTAGNYSDNTSSIPLQGLYRGIK